MGMSEWRDEVELNVNVRLGGQFDWSKITDAVWTAAYVAGIDAQTMGLAVVVAKAIGEAIAAQAPAQPGAPPAAPRIVAAKGTAHGAANSGS